MRSEQPNTSNRGTKDSNQSSLPITCPQLLFWKLQSTIHTSLMLGMVKVMLEIILDVLFWCLSTKLIIEAIDFLKIEQHHYTLIVHTKLYHHHVRFDWKGTRGCTSWPAGRGWSTSGKIMEFHHMCKYWQGIKQKSKLCIQFWCCKNIVSSGFMIQKKGLIFTFLGLQMIAYHATMHLG